MQLLFKKVWGTSPHWSIKKLLSLWQTGGNPTVAEERLVSRSMYEIGSVQNFLSLRITQCFIDDIHPLDFTVQEHSQLKSYCKVDFTCKARSHQKHRRTSGFKMFQKQQLETFTIAPQPSLFLSFPLSLTGTQFLGVFVKCWCDWAFMAALRLAFRL